MLVQMFECVRNEFNPCKSCLISFIRKIHRNTFVAAEKGRREQFEDDAVEWLANLSPEMKKRKMEVDHLLDVMREEHYQVNTVELSSADIRYIMTACKSYNDIKKYVFYKTRKAAVKLKELEKRKEKKEVIEINKEMKELNTDEPVVSGYTGPNYQQIVRSNKHNQLRPLMCDAVPVVFDMDYVLSIREQSRTFSQIMQCSSINKTFPEPCQMYVTSFMKNELLLSDDKLTDGIIVHNDSFEKIFSPEKLVYLSPHAPQLRYHNPGDVYVLGGLQDLHPNEPLSLKKAQQMKIRCGSIPFRLNNVTPKMVKGTGGFILNLDTAFELVLNINLRHHWKSVIKDFVASRRPRGQHQKIDTDERFKNFL